MGGFIAKELQWKDPSHLEDSVQTEEGISKVIFAYLGIKQSNKISSCSMRFLLSVLRIRSSLHHL